MQIVAVSALILTALIGALVAASIRGCALKLAIGAAIALGPPLLLYGLYASQARSGCSGGECGGVMIALGFLALPLAYLVSFGLGMAIQAVLGFAYAAATRRIDRGWVKWGARAVPLLPALAAASFLLAAYRAHSAPVPTSCAGRLHTISVGGDRFLFPVARDVAVRTGGTTARTYDFALKKDAGEFCGLAAGLEAPSRAESLEFFTLDRLSLVPADRRPDGGWTTALFGPGGSQNERSLCASPLPPAATRPFCDGSMRVRTEEYRSTTYKIGVQPAGRPYRRFGMPSPLMFPATLDSGPIARATEGMSRSAGPGGLDIFVSEGKWVFLRRPTQGGEAALPDDAVFCGANPNRFVACEGKVRISAHSEAILYLRLPDVTRTGDVLAAIQEVKAFLAAIRVPSRAANGSRQ